MESLIQTYCKDLDYYMVRNFFKEVIRQPIHASQAPLQPVFLPNLPFARPPDDPASLILEPSFQYSICFLFRSMPPPNSLTILPGLPLLGNSERFAVPISFWKDQLHSFSGNQKIFACDQKLWRRWSLLAEWFKTVTSARGNQEPVSQVVLGDNLYFLVSLHLGYSYVRLLYHQHLLCRSQICAHYDTLNAP